VLPGKPEPYVLRRGEGEHAMLFGDLFTVLLSGDETGNQFGIVVSDSPAGDVIPTHAHNATHETFYVIEGKVRLFFEDTEGVQAVATADSRRLRVRAGRLRARLPDRRGRPDDGDAVRRVRALLPAHGPGHRPREQGAAAVRPGPPRMQAAAQQHDMHFLPQHQWPGT
jgi:quercetin 2,3-dioxygenase